MQFDNAKIPDELNLNRNRIQLWIFLLIWPGLNIFILSAVLHLQDALTFEIFVKAAAKIWGCFLAGNVLFYIIERILIKLQLTYYIERDWLYRPLLVIFVFVFIVPVVDVPIEQSGPGVVLFPLLIVSLEAAIYMAVMYILHQQQQFYLSQLRTQRAELQMLKMQSNPHFLFNTLNLIASEVTTDTEKAKELIYNLSDLLRSTVHLSQQQWIPLEQELQLAELYLLLQQKRFEDRLTFDIDSPNKLSDKQVPSLILLPVIENAVKYGVAPYARPGHVSIHVALQDHYLVIEVLDTGASFNADLVQQGEGMRILTETLRLHFGGDHVAQLSSCEEGASMLIRFPESSHKSRTGWLNES